jgi:hypothetical protein
MDKLSYLAGLVDGEAYVGMCSTGNGNKRFVMEISMTCEPVIDWLVKNYGGQKQFRPRRKAHWQDQWRWRLRGAAATNLFEQLRPMLIVKANI